jgi:hypothetical protein
MIPHQKVFMLLLDDQLCLHEGREEHPTIELGERRTDKVSSRFGKSGMRKAILGLTTGHAM